MHLLDPQLANASLPPQLSLRACDESGLPEGESILFTFRGALVEKAHPFISGMKLRNAIVFISGLGADLIRNAKQPYGVEVLLRDRACIGDVAVDTYGNRRAAYLDYRDEELREETIFDSADAAFSVMDARYLFLKDPSKMEQETSLDRLFGSEEHVAVDGAAGSSTADNAPGASSSAFGKFPSARPSAQDQTRELHNTTQADVDIKPRIRETSANGDTSRSSVLVQSTPGPRMEDRLRPSFSSKITPSAPTLAQVTPARTSMAPPSASSSSRNVLTNGSPASIRQPPSLSSLTSSESSRPRFARINAGSGDAAPRSNLNIEVTPEQVKKEPTFMLGGVSAGL